MQTKLLCAALLLAGAGIPAYVAACDCGDSGCYDCGGDSGYYECDGQMESCNEQMESCDGETQWCDSEMESCDECWEDCEEGMSADIMPACPSCPIGEDCEIMDGCDHCDGTGNQGGGPQPSGGQQGGNPSGSGPASGGDPATPRLPSATMTREQAESVRTSGYYVTGVSRNSSGLVDYVEVAAYQNTDIAAGRRLGRNPFSEGAADDTVQVRLQPQRWIKIDPTWVSNDPIVRAAQREVLSRDVRNLQKKFADADRDCRRSQEGYYATNDKAVRNRFAVDYQKANAKRDALQADLEKRQIQLALTQDSGSGGP